MAGILRASRNTRAHRQPSHGIVLFDGICNLCNRSVNYIIDHDPWDYFRFSPQQSGDALKTVVLIEGGRRYHRSEAALRIARRLSGPVRLLSLFIAVPAFARDWLYDRVAASRYRWFGRLEACRLPTPELQHRWVPAAIADVQSDCKAIAPGEES
jgi:predicted DCC family thiol-disulfide oxidoreductase YuxK